MSSWITYKGLEVPDSSTGDAGINLTDDLKTLADRAPYQNASDPTINDDVGDGFIPGSQWLTTTTLTMWVCTGNSSGAAKWRSLYRRIENAIVLAPEVGIGGTDNRAIQLDTGGNSRGVNAVDFQRTRNTNTQVASGAYSFIAGGRHNTSSGECSHAEGGGSTAGNLASHAEGWYTTAFGNSAHAEGDLSLAAGNFSHAEGSFTWASSCSSHAEGKSTLAFGYYSHTEGQQTAAGKGAHAEGDHSHAYAYFSHAEGSYSLANGVAAHAEGRYTGATSDYSHAEGKNSWAQGVAAHAEGNCNVASGPYSHAEGSIAVASGWASHAEGLCNTADGGFSHAEGRSSVSSGIYSHAGGCFSKSHLRAQWARSSGAHNFEAGTAQSTLTHLFRTTTNNTATELTLGGYTPDSSSRFVIVDGQTLSCFINIVGRKENGGTNDHASFLRQVLIRREGSTTSLVGSEQTIGTDINPAGWGGVAITADDTNESLKIEVTGAASTNIRWTATVLASEAADAGI